MKKLIAALCLSMVFVVAASPLPSMAGSKTLLPNQFTLATWSVPLAMMEPLVRRNSYWLGSSDGPPGVAYESELKLPLGATITKVEVNAESVQPVEVWVARAKLGDAEQTVATFNFSGDRGWYPTSDIRFAKVTSGYRYWIHLDVAGSGAYVYGVRVSYR